MSDKDDRKFMRRALALARRGLGVASPNPTVGCLIVREGGVVGKAYMNMIEWITLKSRLWDRQESGRAEAPST